MRLGVQIKSVNKHDSKKALPMLGATSKIDKMSEGEARKLRERLLKHHWNECFLCGKTINSDVDKTEIDHVKPKADNWPDEELNWALMHDQCNYEKRAKNLELAGRVMARCSLEHCRV